MPLGQRCDLESETQLQVGDDGIYLNLGVQNFKLHQLDLQGLIP